MLQRLFSLRIVSTMLAALVQTAVPHYVFHGYGHCVSHNGGDHQLRQ